MYKPIRSVELVDGGNIIKQGEKFTLSFRLFNEHGKEVDVTGKTVGVKIANKSGVIHESPASITVGGLVTFTISENLGHGEMRLEFTVLEGIDLIQKYPADGWIGIRITPSLDDLGFGGINIITVQQLKEELNQIHVNHAVEVDSKLSGMQTQINQIVVIGDSSIEAAQARVDESGFIHPTLKDRIDGGFNKIIIPENELPAHKLENASLTTKGHIQLSNSIDSVSETLAATPKAVKTTYDKAVEVADDVGQKASLLTTNKTSIVLALNELFTNASNGKTDIATVIGSPAIASNTFAQLKTHIQNAKNKAASNLTTKGIVATGTETLDALVDKIANITMEKSLTGLTPVTSFVLEVRGLDFSPTVILAYSPSSLEQNEFALLQFDSIGTILKGSWRNSGLAGDQSTYGVKHSDGFSIRFSQNAVFGNVKWFCW